MQNIQFIYSNNKTYAKIIGEISNITVQNIKNEISQNYKGDELILDFEEVTFIDEYGIGLLVYCKQRVTNNLQIINSSKQVDLVIKLSGFKTI